MKIIDLLNKIANGEEVPKKIKYNLLEKNYQILVYDEEEQEYRYENDYNNFCTFPNHHLNDEVEIIEEKKIPEKLSTYFSLEKDCENDNIQYANYNFKTMYEKINDICDYLKSKGE